MRQIPSVQLVANPTSRLWSQAYSTLNLYIVLHMGGDDVARAGRDTLEQIQREYFALDTKDLASIKEAVSRVVKEIEEERDYSMTLVVISQDSAYIVIASCGKVAMLRGERYGIIASGEEGSVEAFSGKLLSGDVLIIGTCDFFEKVSSENLSLLAGGSIQDISEQIAPLIYTSSSGGEAAILLQIQDGEVLQQEVDKGTQVADPTLADLKVEEKGVQVIEKYRLRAVRLFDIAVYYFQHHKKQVLLGGGVLVLLMVLMVLLTRDSLGKRNSESEAVVAQVNSEVGELLSDAEAVASVEPSRAITLLTKAKGIVESRMTGLDKSSQEYNELSSLLAKIQSQLDKLEGGTPVELEEFFSDPEFSDVVVTGHGDNLFAASGTKTVRLSGSGKVEEEGKVSSEIDAMYAVDNALYVLNSSGVEKIDINSLSGTNVINKKGIDVAAFGNNAYLLTGDDIVRSSGGSYFSGSSPLSQASSLSIDGAVYVLEDLSIQKFLKGAETEFNLEGLVTPFGNKAKLYTSPELEELYVLDPENKRIVVLEKEGRYETQYKSDTFLDATSFVVIKDTVYVGLPSGVSSFEL